MFTALCRKIKLTLLHYLIDSCKNSLGNLKIGIAPNLISTNLTVDELSRRYNPQIASRLRGSYTRVAFLGDDIRVVKNRRM